MDERTLLLLGILTTQRWHGYQIHDFIEKNLSRVTDMKKPTAYALLERLRKAGLIQEAIEQEGNRPPRHVYTITPTGEETFRSLLVQNLSTADSARQTGDIGLMFLDHLPPEEAVSCLEQRLAGLEAAIQEQSAIPCRSHPLGVELAVDRQRNLLQADREWLQQTIVRLKTSPS